jgi:hypothetical protein
MDGTLRRVTKHTWVGTLHGYRIHVFRSLGYWSFAVINGRGHVEVCPRAASLAYGARRARAWIEEGCGAGIRRAGPRMAAKCRSYPPPACAAR